MSTIRLNTVSTVDAICAMLEDDIYSLRYPPGAKISEKDLTSRYGVSRNTVREAIAFFISNGLLEKIANKGVYVRSVTVDGVREIFHLRELLEGEAIRMIMSSGPIPLELFHAAEEVSRIDPAVDWRSSINADMAFHKLLVHCSKSERLVRLYESLLAEVKLCVYQSYEFIAMKYVPVRTENAEQHLSILRAMQAGDLGLALKRLAIHLDSAVNRYIDGCRMKEYAESE